MRSYFNYDSMEQNHYLNRYGDISCLKEDKIIVCVPMSRRMQDVKPICHTSVYMTQKEVLDIFGIKDKNEFDFEYLHRNDLLYSLTFESGFWIGYRGSGGALGGIRMSLGEIRVLINMLNDEKYTVNKFYLKIRVVDKEEWE